MPESPFDDPFAELFGKLPDPRSGARDTGPAGSPDGADPAASRADDSVRRAAEPAADAAPAAPMSRREARNAARAKSGRASGDANADAPAEPDVRAPQPGPVRAAAATTPSPTAAGAAAPVPATGVGETPADAWLLAGAARASAPGDSATSVARGGESPRGRTATLVDAPPTLEDLLAQPHVDPHEQVTERRRRGRRIGGWIALGIAVLMIGGLVVGGVWVWNTYEDNIREVMGWEEPRDYEAGMATGEALVTISSGDVPSTISRALFEAGVTMTPDAFYRMLIDTGRNPIFYPGVYQLQQKMTSEAALAALEDPANKLENSALLPEGLTVEQSLTTLSESLGIPIEDFQAAVADPAAYGVAVDPAVVAAGGNPLEGWLFPAMYEFDPGVTATDVIATMVARTTSSLDAAGVPAEDRQRILTIASIIQREARYEADMQKVSRVIQNRLDPGNQETFGLLQMDSTAQYGYGEMHAGSASTSAEAQYDDNPWNTYVVTGLPVGPIANPGDVAINAAMNPAEGDWLYFVTVNLDTGETVFTSNLADHNRAVAQWQAWCVDNPDSGC